ncbi:hypothetical protein BLNAU_21355 [Blattamonas nauphoetae]|uniref:Uncharacterized protein n=1 Tax=Blattamonas nauphoetae TaxID=2049346 RepID=A0ABQ9WX49_9EUKA|nr:hypothetical protein BLNAU_21355 [Blattamonas nauphoetae]
MPIGTEPPHFIRQSGYYRSSNGDTQKSVQPLFCNSTLDTTNTISLPHSSDLLRTRLPHQPPFRCFLGEWKLGTNKSRAGKQLLEQGGWSEDETEQEQRLLSKCSTIVEQSDTPHSFSAHRTRRLLFSTLPSSFIASLALKTDDTRFSLSTPNTPPTKHICEWADIDSTFGVRKWI